MKKNNSIYSYLHFLHLLLCFIVLLIITIIIYGYNSGSCKRQKNYICNDNFCLYKEFNLHLNSNIKNEINTMVYNKQIQKRVNISTFPENIFNCALPNKKGITISTNNVIKYAPNLINFYQNQLCKFVSELINLKLFPTDLSLPTSCAILIYENEGDWINWHYDYNYYDGRFFTILIPVTDNLTCTEFQFQNDNNTEINSIQLINGNCVCFEGNFLYHRASKLCKNEKRVILSCQYVTDNNMSFFNKMRLKIKDFAYIGKF